MTHPTTKIMLPIYEDDEYEARTKRKATELEYKHDPFLADAYRHIQDEVERNAEAIDANASAIAEDTVAIVAVRVRSSGAAQSSASAASNIARTSSSDVSDVRRYSDINYIMPRCVPPPPMAGFEMSHRLFGSNPLFGGRPADLLGHVRKTIDRLLADSVFSQLRFKIGATCNCYNRMYDHIFGYKTVHGSKYMFVLGEVTGSNAIASLERDAIRWFDSHPNCANRSQGGENLGRNEDVLYNLYIVFGGRLD